jgi:hypothetical protein
VRKRVNAPIDVFVDALDLAEMSFEGVDPATTGRPSYPSLSYPEVVHLPLSEPRSGYFSACGPPAAIAARPLSARTGQIDIDDKAAANESLTSIIGSERPAIY